MKKPTHLRVRLRRITIADFRRSDRTLFESVPKRERAALRGADAVAFVSKTGNQILFVTRATTVAIHGGQKREIITSVRLRLTGGTFNPLMLANYAGDCGLVLDGIKRFEEHYTALRDAA